MLLPAEANRKRLFNKWTLTVPFRKATNATSVMPQSVRRRNPYKFAATPTHPAAPLVPVSVPLSQLPSARFLCCARHHLIIRS